jgi:hypothetical protein
MLEEIVPILKNFRDSIYRFFPSRRDAALDLVDALSQKKQLSSTTQSICIESTSFSRIFLLTVVVTTAFAKKSSKSLYLQRILAARYDDNCFF